MTIMQREFSTKERPDPPVPGPDLCVQVLGNAASNGDFLFGGFVISEGIRRTLEFLGHPLESFRDVLDFGCGSGRVLRWFRPYRGVNWTGSDISASAIEWNQRHLGFAKFIANGMQPPLPLPDGSFDLIYAVSVVTHLSEELQNAWLAELSRLLRPGGIAALTVSGEEVARWRLSPDEFAKFRAAGHSYKYIQDGGLHGLPDFYQDAFHSRAYVVSAWARYFQPVAYLRNGMTYLQDLAVLRKPGTGDAVPAPGVIEVDLPFGSFWSPLVAARVTGDVLSVEGWTFQHHGGPVSLTVCIDDQPLATGVADLPTLRVGDVFPAYPGAKVAGFKVPVSIVGLATGPHVVSALAQDKPIPFMTTYFFVE
jgi:SAM-dependent methyltransferase